jgi:Glycosyltransferase family 87
MEAMRAMSRTSVRWGERSRKWIDSKPDRFVGLLYLLMSFWSWSLLGSSWVEAMRPAPEQFIDYYQDWGSARNYVDNLPVYTPHSTSIPRHLSLPSNPNPSIEYNAHPPTSVLLALPLARLDYPDAALFWNTISLAAFLISMSIVVAVLSLPRGLLLPALALLPFCQPVLGNFQLGQLNLVLLLLLTTIWALERSGRSSTAGLLLGAAAAIKLFPAYLGVYYLARGRIRPMLAIALSFSALTIATGLILGPDTYRDYIRIVLPAQVKFQGFGYNHSIAGLWHKLFDPTDQVVMPPAFWPSPALARWGIYGSDLAITLIVAMLSFRARTPAAQDLAFASAVTAMLLVSPVTWEVTMVLLLVPIAILSRSADRLRWMPAALITVLAILWLPQPLLTILTMGGGPVSVVSPAFILGASSLKSYALLATFALGLAAFRAERKVEGPGSSEGRFDGRCVGDLAASELRDDSTEPRTRTEKRKRPAILDTDRVVHESGILIDCGLARSPCPGGWRIARCPGS